MDRCNTCKHRNEEVCNVGWVKEFDEEGNVIDFICGGYEREETADTD